VNCEMASPFGVCKILSSVVGEFLACAITRPGVNGRVEGPVDFSFGPDREAPVRTLFGGTLEALSLHQHCGDQFDRDLDAFKVGKRKGLS